MVSFNSIKINVQNKVVENSFEQDFLIASLNDKEIKQSSKESRITIGRSWLPKQGLFTAFKSVHLVSSWPNVKTIYLDSLFEKSRLTFEHLSIKGVS